MNCHYSEKIFNLKPEIIKQTIKDCNKKFVIGITGASASGKSIFANKLQKILGQKCLLISQDNFYKNPPKNIDIKEYNFDDPKAINYDSIQKYIKDILVKGNAYEPIYSFEEHKTIGTRQVNFNGKFIIEEGIFSMNDKKLTDLMDLRIFIDTGLDICLARRIQRDTKERGRNLDSILTQYNKFVRPGYFNFIASRKNICDIVVPNEAKEQYQRALNIVGNYLNKI